MATTIFLVRHAEHEMLGRVLCGRMPGVSLGDAGRQQALWLGRRLQREGLAALYTSPLARARETATAIGQQCRLATNIATEFDEIDFGQWTGAFFDRLDPDPAWQRWNAKRSGGRPPGGESMNEAQTRAVAGLRLIEAQYPESATAIVSHADVIKSVLAWCLGLSMDFHARFEIGPASVSAISMWGTGAKVLWMNEAVTS